ncbi:MAG: sulfite exporter TauE/SafE family protein [Actinomycetota bacterium]|nr:sulfite exporter TauE/SafE family protein [Actinomycetota bacterium]HWM34137.1 sulfite exporter TauE/SafE family protein [Pseudolysinimonas sp.]
MNGYPLRRVIALVVVGLMGGLLSGAFGVGGGIIMVPLLMWFAGMDQRRAAATSLVAIVPSAIAGSIQYAVQGEVDVVAGLIVAAGGVGGSLIGTRLLRTLSLGWLRWLFIGLLVLVAVRLFFEVPARGTALELGVGVVVALVLLGVVMGIASGLFGIGGGVILVPVLIAFFGLGDLLAKGTSLLAMIPTSVTGSIANTRAGLVRLGDGLIAGVSAVAASFGGVALAFLLPPRLAVILFAIFILIVVAQLVIRAVRAKP